MLGEGAQALPRGTWRRSEAGGRLGAVLKSGHMGVGWEGQGERVPGTLRGMFGRARE